MTPDTNCDGGCKCDHANPLCKCNASPEERAAAFSVWIDSITSSPLVDEEDLRFMPLKGQGKEPAIEGTARLESKKADLMLYTAEEAYTALYHGHPGFAVYFGRRDHGTESLLAVDRDEPDNFPDGEMPETGVIGVSGSGTDPGHYYYTHDGGVSNSAPVDVGEVRASNYYCVTPGSIHDTGGVYHLSESGEPGHIEQDDIPEALQPSSYSGTTTESADPIELDPPEDLSEAEFTNKEGVPLETVREWDEKLDDHLSRLNPPGYGHNDTSKFDWHTVGHLHFWRFDEQTISDILHRYRNREKLYNHPNYVERTIRKATSAWSEQYDPASGGSDSETPTPVLPLARLSALEHDERVRYAKKRGIEWPSVDEVRDRIRDSIIESISDGEMTVESAPTGSGKTHTTATEPWSARPDITDEQPVVHAHRTHEARDQAREMSDEAGVDAYTLKGRKELCPVAAGEYDPDNSHGNREIIVDGDPVSEWIDHRCDRQGIPFSHAHRWLESEVEGDLPCQEGDTECAALGQFDGIPRDDNGDPSHDVIHCTHQFLHVPGLRMHTNVVIDEKPSFGIELASDAIDASINTYLGYVDAPVDDRSELVQAAKTGKDPSVGDESTVEGVMTAEHNEGFAERMDGALNGTDTRVECDECGGDGEIDDGRGDIHDLTAYPEHAGARASTSCPNCNGTGTVVEARGQPPLEWYRQNPEAHAMAPAFARAIWNAEETAGGRKHARVPYRPPRWGNEQHDEHGWNRVYVDVVLNEQWEVVDAEAIPDFSLANSVIGLDAHPQPEDPYWLANVHEDMTTNFSLSQQERTLYRRYERGLHTYQAMEGNQPVGSGEWLDQGQGRKFEAIIHQMADHYKEEFDAAITSKEAKATIRRAMEDAGITDPEMMHYGEEESRNDFAGKDVGLVVGSIDPGDDMIVNLCARLGLDVDPAYKECPVCEGTGYTEDDDGHDEMCETCGTDGEVRERGRTFDGEDAEMADSVLKGVREHHVAQSAGRWARNADDPDDTAEVFILTDAAPAGFIDAKVPGVTWAANEDQRKRLEYVRENAEGVTAKELAEAAGCSKRTANRDLKRWRENGLVEVNPGEGPYGADIYWPGDEFNPAGAVELDGPDGPETAQTGIGTDDVQGTNTYSVSIFARPDCAFNTPQEERGEWAYQTALPWYERVSAPPE